MSFTYSGNPAASELDLLRFMLRDTDSTTALMQDEEINYINSTYRNINMRLALGFRQCALSLSRLAIKRTLGPQSEDNSKRLAMYEKLADMYESIKNNSGLPPTPVYQHDLVFEKGMMENV